MMCQSPGSYIRLATIADAGELAHVHVRTVVSAYADIIPATAAPVTQESLAREWSAAFDDPSLTAFLAEENGEPVGTVAIRGDPDLRGVGQLRRLYVLPHLWARGTGTALYLAAIEAMEEAGYLEAGLWVLEKNTRARQFYERRGWKLVPGAVVHWPEQEVTEVRYRLVLGR